jgi:nitrate reductase NapD
MTIRGLSRRALLEGRLIARPVASIGDNSTATIHISSAVVSVMPLQRDRLIQSLAALPGVEVHHQDTSKVVIVMEAADSGALGSRLAEIAAWPGVLSANMVFERLENLADIGA